MRTSAVIIARPPDPDPARPRCPHRRLVHATTCAAVALGVIAWIAYARQGLILSHYDARAHLVVARRVIDSLTPGWTQIGAVWLPLPHLINLLPTQVDFFYRTGVFASAVSIACLAVGARAAARIVLGVTGSAIGAVTAAALFVLNPSLLYLHVTPMTEPLLLAVTFTAVLWMREWLTGGARRVPTRLGWVLAAAAWTRYEAWPVVAAAVAIAGYVVWLDTRSAHRVFRAVARLAVWPATAVALFLVISRLTVGAWFVTGGFYVPDPLYDGRFWRSAAAVWWGTHQLSSYAMEAMALVSLGALTLRARHATHRSDLVVAALCACAALPIYAFYQGHPFRIRYMVPSVAACAVFAGIGVGLIASSLTFRSGRIRTGVPVGTTVLLVALTMVQSPTWSQHTLLIEEAEWDRPATIARRAVTACLAPAYHGELVMASMGSLAHYMQDLSAAGFDIAEFLHEGNGLLWQQALETGPAAKVGWMLVEEQAEGGDVLARRIRDDASFTRGMRRVCEGGGVALYRRD